MSTLKNIQTEVDASYLYSWLASKEEDEMIASVFKEMSEIEFGHAHAFMKKNGWPVSDLPKPSFRARIIKTMGTIFGHNMVLGLLLDTEKSLSNALVFARRKTNLTPSVSDTAHVAILQNLLNNQQFSPTQLTRFERRHRNIGGNALRAAVLGGNDGLVSNFSLIMGVAGATTSQHTVFMTGIAGLLAGALSMAMGEWISVKSSQELYENQMDIEMDELLHNPEGEERELALIYKSKGIEEEQAKKMAAEIMQNSEQAHEVLVKEELGIQPDDLKGSAMQAALSSFILFAIGAIIPLIPFLIWNGNKAIIASAIAGAIGLFIIGAVITLFTGKSILFSGIRQMLFGLAAAAITFGIGRLIGVSLI